MVESDRSGNGSDGRRTSLHRRVSFQGGTTDQAVVAQKPTIVRASSSPIVPTITQPPLVHIDSIPETDDCGSTCHSRSSTKSRNCPRHDGILAPDVLHGKRDTVFDQINRGSIIMTQDRHGRRLSTFSNLPIETRLTEGRSMDDLLQQIQQRYENTYQLEPAKGIPNTGKLKRTLQTLIERELADFSGRYSAFTAKYYSRVVADLVKNEMKDRVDPRYRVIAHVHIGENNGQDLKIASSFLWDKERDRYIDMHLKLDNHAGGPHAGVFIVAKVFFLYWD